MVSLYTPSFGGLFDTWSPLLAEPLLVNPFHSARAVRQKPRRPEAWCQPTNMPGVFEPEDITMKTEDKKITLHGVHTFGDSTNGTDKLECTRHVQIPDDVEPSSVKMLWNRGELFVKGEWKKSEEEAEMKKLLETAKDIPIGQGAGPVAAQVKKPLELSLNLSHYKPEEIKVKLNGNKLVVSGEQKKEGEDLFLAEQFYRMITVPDYVDKDQLKTSLSEDGILQITAPVVPQLEGQEKPAELTKEEKMETPSEQ